MYLEKLLNGQGSPTVTSCTHSSGGALSVTEVPKCDSEGIGSWQLTKGSHIGREQGGVCKIFHLLTVISGLLSRHHQPLSIPCLKHVLEGILLIQPTPISRGGRQEDAA